MNQDGWELIFWLGAAFDYEIRFRDALTEIVETLCASGSVELELPPYFAGEDFVEGTLTFEGSKLAVYYEYSLGYLSLLSPSREGLDEVAKHISRLVRVV